MSAQEYVPYWDVALWAALRHRRVVGRLRNNPVKDDVLNDFWEAVEGSEAKAVKRQALPKWRIHRLRGESQPHPWEYDVSGMPTDPSADEALQGRPHSLAGPDGGIAGDILCNKHART